jgi:hypothetical protein
LAEAVASYAPNVEAAKRTLTQARREATWAMQLAARWLAVEPTALRVAAYRAFRAAQDEPGLPSPLTISLLFAGWQRACEHVAAPTCDEVAVEADVVRALYGDPSCRRRAHGTCDDSRRRPVPDNAPRVIPL